MRRLLLRSTITFFCLFILIQQAKSQTLPRPSQAMKSEVPDADKGAPATTKKISTRDYVLKLNSDAPTSQSFWLEFSHDGQLLADVGLDKTIRIWDVSQLSHHRSQETPLCFV
jgi:WD40 repeat protein